MERILSPRGAARRATDIHLSRPGASQAGGRLESGGARRRGGRCGPGIEQRPPTAPPRDRQHEQAGRINKWVPFRLQWGSGAQPRAGGRGGLGGPAPSAAAPSLGEVLQRRVCFGPAPCISSVGAFLGEGRTISLPLDLDSSLHPTPNTHLSGRVGKLGPLQPTSPASSLHLAAKCGEEGATGAGTRPQLQAAAQ